MNVYIFNAGCLRQNYEAEKIKLFFQLNGVGSVDRIEEADIAYIGTCGFTRYMDEVSLQPIKKIRKINNKITTIIGGCLPRINQQRLLSLQDDNCIILRDHTQLNGIIKQRAVLFADMEQEKSQLCFTYNGFPESFLSRCKRYLFEYGFSFALSRWFQQFTGANSSARTCLIEIAKGCLGKCTFCAIKFAQGRLKSKPLGDIIFEFKQRLAQGYSIINIFAGDCGCYGLDIGTNFIALLKGIFAIQGNYGVLISGVNMEWIIAYYQQLLPILKQNQHKILELYIPIQSGSNRILRLMKRNHTAEGQERYLTEIREQTPNIRLFTSVIVGFPSETRRDFAETKKLLKKIKFDKALIFKYDDRPGTEATQMQGKISERIKIKRMHELELTQISLIIKKLCSRQTCRNMHRGF